MQITLLPISKNLLKVFIAASLAAAFAFEISGQESEVRDLTGEEPTVEALIEALRPIGEAADDIRRRGVSEAAPKPACKIYLDTNRRGVSSAPVAIDVLFATDSAELALNAESTLHKLGQALGSPELGSLCVGIEGHTDDVGTEAYNLILSQRRAERVKRYLIETFAIESDRLLVSGHGESRPLAGNDGQDGRRRNRRVQIQAFGG